MNAEDITKALKGVWHHGKGSARCPAHNDKNPSLSLANGRNGRPLVRCHAQCSQELVIAALRDRGLWPGDDRELVGRRDPGDIIAADITSGTTNEVIGADTGAGPSGLPNWRAVLKSEPDDFWDYRDASGRLVGYTVRVRQRDGGKKVLPVIWTQDGWRIKAFPVPRPLYNLPALLERPEDPVLVLEGEKTTVAAQRHFDALAVITWPGGCKAVAQTDWSPLRSRRVTIWPDADAEGAGAAARVAQAANDAGAAEIRLVVLPGGLPEGWDLADDIPAGMDIHALLRAATDWRTTRLKSLGLVTAADLLVREFRDPKWAVPSLIPEGCTLLGGKPKSGKSWLALDFAVAAAGGGRALGNIECEAGQVLYLALEDTERRLSGRLRAVLQGSPAPNDLYLVTQWKRIDDGGLEDIRAWITTQPNPRLVIVDTFEKMRGRPDRDGGVYRDDYQAIGVYKEMADQTGVPVLVIHHVRKAEASDPLDAISGTAGLTGSCDTVLVLKRESGSPYGTIYVRGRDVQEAQVALQFEAATGRWLKLGPAEDFRKSQERKAVVRALLDAGHAMSPTELAEATGRKRGAVKTLLGKMVRAAEVIAVGNGSYLPPQDTSDAWFNR